MAKYRISSGQIISDQDPNIETYKKEGAVLIDDKSNVGLISTKDAINQVGSDVNKFKTTTGIDLNNPAVQNIAAQTAQKVKDYIANKKTPSVPDTTQKDTEKKVEQTSGTYTVEDLIEMGIRDFSEFKETGVNTGLYRPTEKGWEQLGAYGISTPDETKKSQLEQAVSDVNDQIDTYVNDLTSYNVDEDPAFQQTALDIRAKYEKMRQEMIKTNKAREQAYEQLGYTSGMAEYAGSTIMGIMGEELNQANERLAEITRQENSAISEARSAYQKGEYERFNTIVNALDKTREAKQQALDSYNQTLADALKAQQDQSQFELDVLKYQLDYYKVMQDQGITPQQQALRDTAVASLYSAGITDPVQLLNALNDAGGDFTLEEISDSLGFITGKGIDLPEDELDKLLSPNELALFNAPAGSTLRDVLGQIPKTELTPTQKFTEENNLSKQFESLVGDARKATTQIGVIQQSLEEAKRAVAEGKSLNAPSQGILVAFQKLLDPSSVVRESEYARSPEGLSLISRIEGFSDKLKQGGAGVPIDELEEFVNVAESYLSNYQDNMINQAKRIKLISEQRGLNLSSILTQDVIDLMENQPKQTLDDYLDKNPDKEDYIYNTVIPAFNAAEIEATPENIIQYIESGGFISVGSDTNIGEYKVSIAAGIAKRTNNPGNLVYIGQAGAKKDPNSRFAMFDTPQAGFQALINDLNAKKAPGGKLGPNSTLAQLINVYAPPSENATSTYINQIASALGISKNTKLKDIDTFQLAKAIAKKESSTTII